MKSKKMLSAILLTTMVSSSLFTSIATAATTATTTVAPASTYGVEYEGQVQNIGWQAPVTTTGDQTDISNVSIAGTVHQGLRVEALKITGTNLPTGVSITYQGQVQNIGWQAPVTTTGDNAIADAPIAGSVQEGLRVEAFKMTLNGLPGYAVKYQTQVQNKGWMDAVETVNGTDITSATMAGTQNQGLRMEALKIEIVKTDTEKALEVTAINAVNTAITSKSTTDVQAAKSAIASIADTVEQTTLTANLTSNTLVVITQPVTPVTPTIPVTPVTPTPTTTVTTDSNLSSIIDIDSPTDGQTITSSTMTLKGWALDPKGIEGITIDIDGKPFDAPSCNVSRPDVQKLFPQYNTLVSGYSESEDITNLSNGIHTMTATVDGKDGKSSTATRKINVQLPSASHENTSLETMIDSDCDFDTTNGWDVSDLNKTLDSISAQYLNNQISQAQAQKEMYAYTINLPGHPNTRVSKVYFKSNTTSETSEDGVASFAWSGGHYNKCKIWLNTNGTNTIHTIGADVTSD